MKIIMKISLRKEINNDGVTKAVCKYIYMIDNILFLPCLTIALTAITDS